MITEVTAIVGIAEVNSHWSKFPMKDIIYNRTYWWSKTRSISIGYNPVATSDGTVQSGGTAIMAVDEL